VDARFVSTELDVFICWRCPGLGIGKYWKAILELNLYKKKQFPTKASLFISVLDSK